MVRPKSPYSYANSICMSRQLFKGSYLIVEGISDKNLFQKFVDDKECKVKSFKGKDFAIKIFKILLNRNITGILLILDADFNHLENILPFNENVFYTDTHDIETMIISSEAFKIFLQEFTMKKELLNFEKRLNKNLKQILIETCIFIGYARWASFKNKWRLRFKHLDYTIFINNNDLSLNKKKFISELINNSPNVQISYFTIINEIERLRKNSEDIWMICCGHDLTEILCIGLNVIFGRFKDKLITKEEIEAVLRLTYEFRHFKMTKLYKLLKNWENNQLSYKIFPQH
ncbi:MAG: DUF4435 domain-containing protein [Promethearchaeota archaeon]